MKKYRVFVNGIGYNVQASNKEIAIKRGFYWYFHDSTNFTKENLRHRRKEELNKEERFTVIIIREG